MALLQRDLDNVEYNQAISMGQTQSAINIIMRMGNLSFEQAREMIGNKPNLEKYQKKVISWLKTSPQFKEGLILSARKVLDN